MYSKCITKKSRSCLVLSMFFSCVLLVHSYTAECHEDSEVDWTCIVQYVPLPRSLAQKFYQASWTFNHIPFWPPFLVDLQQLWQHSHVKGTLCVLDFEDCLISHGCSTVIDPLSPRWKVEHMYVRDNGVWCIPLVGVWCDMIDVCYTIVYKFHNPLLGGTVTP